MFIKRCFITIVIFQVLLNSCKTFNYLIDEKDDLYLNNTREF